MNSFDFSDVARQVRICGKVYTMNFNIPDFAKYSEKIQNELSKMKDNQKLTKRATDAFRAFLDEMLGEGSFDEIFSEQEITMPALTRLLQFLAVEAAEEARTYKKFDFSDLQEIVEQSEAQE